MLVTYITDAFFPEISGGSIRSYYFCRGLIDYGHEVSLVTKRVQCNNGECENHDHCMGERVAWEVLGVPGRYGSAIFPGSAMIPMLTLGSASSYGLSKPDVVFGSSPSFGSVVSAFLAHRLFDVPLVVEFRDPWIRSFKTHNTHIYAGSPRGRVLSGIEDRILSECSVLVVTNPGVLRELVSVHGDDLKDKARVIYHGADIGDIYAGSPIEFEKPTILFAGRVVAEKGFAELIEALRYLPDYQIVVCGPGDNDRLRALAEQKSVSDRFIALGPVPHTEIGRYMRGADMLFLGLGNSRDLEYALPSKIFEYIISRKPVLAFCAPGGELDDFVRKTGCGLTADAGPQELASLAEKLMEDKGDYVIDGGSVDKFSRERRSREFCSLLEEISC